MEHIHVPFKKFDLDGFINKTISFIEAQISKEIDPSAAIVWVETSATRNSMLPRLGDASGHPHKGVSRHSKHKMKGSEDVI